MSLACLSSAISTVRRARAAASMACSSISVASLHLPVRRDAAAGRGAPLPSAAPLFSCCAP